MRTHQLIRLIPLLAAGCVFENDNRVAGGAQDFPNTLALGAALSSHLSDHAEWDQFSAIPSVPSLKSADSMVVAPESLDADPAAGFPGGTGLAKTAAALADTVYFDYSDTATLKVARRIRSRETILILRQDTLIRGDTLTFRYDGTVFDGIPGNELLLESKGAELWKSTGRRHAYRYENRDSAGGFDRAVFTERLPAPALPGFRYRRLVMLPGPDGDMAATADNRPAHFSFDRVRETEGAADTLESFDVSDADGDGALWGEGDSGIVDIRLKTPAPALRPFVDSAAQKMRAILFKDEAKTYPISFRESRAEKSGRRVVFAVRGTRGGADSTFGAGDTAIVSLHVYPPPGSELAEKHIRYKVILSEEAKQYAGNRLLRYSLEATWNRDSLASTKWTFTPDQPVPAGELSVSGGIDFDADFGGGRMAAGAGRFENKVIDINLLEKSDGGKERRFRIKWKASGELLEQSRSD